MDVIWSLDPGVTTGLAVIYSAQAVALQSLRDERVVETLRSLPTPSLVFVEGAPANGDPRQIQRVARIEEFLRNELGLSSSRIMLVLPGHWKPMAKALRWRHQASSDQHQADAYNIARYTIIRRFGNDIGELPCVRK